MKNIKLSGKLKEEILTFEFEHNKYGSVVVTIKACEGDTFYDFDYENEPDDRETKQDFENELEEHIRDNGYFGL